ncbi:unnamed protein product [Pedinophyceae sp. YPF-701]|nr:unnamed protein product [Pedinophyceae sp. YPF-701]
MPGRELSPGKPASSRAQQRGRDAVDRSDAAQCTMGLARAPGSLFAPVGRRERLEQTAPVACGTGSLLTRATVGIRDVYGRADGSIESNGRDVLAAGSADTVPDTLPCGRVVVGTDMPMLAGRYKFVAEVGAGGSAQVLLMHDTARPPGTDACEGPSDQEGAAARQDASGGRMVVAKVLRAHMATAGLREAHVMRFLARNDPHGATCIPRVLQCLRWGPHVVLVLERCYESLLDLLAAADSLPPPRYLRMVRKITLQLLIGLQVRRGRAGGRCWRAHVP